MYAYIYIQTKPKSASLISLVLDDGGRNGLRNVANILHTDTAERLKRV